MTSPGSSSPATRSWSATSAGPICMPRARRASRSWRARLYRSLHERLLALPDHLLVYPAHYAGSVCGRGLSGHPTSTHRLRAPPQRGTRRRLRGRLRRGADQGHPSGARAPVRDRGREPLGPASRRDQLNERRVELGLGENAAQFTLLVAVNALVGAMVGLERSTLPLIGSERVRGQLHGRGPLLHRRLRARQVADQPGRWRARRSDRTAAAADHRLVPGVAGAAADRGRPELGVGGGGQPLPRRQPGPGLVDDGVDEDRPGRARSAVAWRWG